MVSRQNIAILSGTETRMVELPEGKKLRICSAVLTEYRRVTDGQTDILRQHIPRYAYTSRGKIVRKFDDTFAVKASLHMAAAETNSRQIASQS